MARRGQFGRLPRAAPDLTNTLVALIREANAQEDQNMVSAWKEGGKVDGKGVDDERLLDHLKMRRDNVSKDDPMWDEWNNNYIQYDFAINESKMALKNDQGKLSDAGMAAFYKKWAGREDVQQDSEFYRHLMSQAAKWNEAAKTRSAGRGAANAAAAHEKWKNGYYKEHVQASETATGYLLLIAKTVGAAPPSANSLEDINPNSTDYAKFQDIMADGVAATPEAQTLIDEMNREISKTQPNWKFSESNVMDLLDRGDKGLKKLIQESTTNGERNDWSGRREGMKYEKTRIKQQHANERVQIAADTFATELGECAGDPYCARNATQKLRNKLGAEAKNIIAGAGGVDPLTGKLQDTKTASALMNTLTQLDGALTGKPIVVPAARQAVKGEEPADVPGYNIFDAAAGADGTTGWMAKTLNDVNGDKDKLDAGGWIMTTPMTTSDGRAVLDGHGTPRYNSVIYDPKTPIPDGAVAVAGAQQFSDNTRTSQGPAAGPQGVGPTVRSPVTYIQPSEPNITYEDPVSKTSVDPKRIGDVKLFAGTQQVAAPWVELRGVRGPDGVTRTLYRTGSGAVGDEYLFHEQPPVPQGTKPNAAGQFVVPVKTVVPEKGEPYLQADVTDFAAGVKSARTPKGKSGQYNLGTYASAGAAQTSLAIGSLYNAKDPDAGRKADNYMRQYTQGLESLPLNDPNRIAGMRDLPQLTQTASLYKQTNGNPTALTAAYADMNQYNPKQQAYADTLNRAGFTAQQYGKPEFERRMTLLAGIDDADARIANRPPINSGGYGGYWGMQSGGRGLSSDPRNVAERALLDQQKRDVLNPSISVSNIKVPGMPSMTPPGGQGQAVNPYAPGWMGQMGQVPGVGLPGPTTKFTPPTQMQGPSTSGKPMGGPLDNSNPKTGIAGPTTANPTPVVPPPSGPAAGPNAATPNPTAKVTGSTGFAGNPGKAKDDIINPYNPGPHYGGR